MTAKEYLQEARRCHAKEDEHFAIYNLITAVELLATATPNVADMFDRKGPPKDHPDMVEANPSEIPNSSLPAGLPPLPEGAVYLGKGGTFQAPKTGFWGWYWVEGATEWRHEHDEYFGTGTSAHFAAPVGSEVARLNGLGPTLDDGKWSTAIRIDALEQEINALTKERDEARDIAADLDTQLKVKDARIANLEQERDALREKLNAERMQIKAIREAIGSFNNVIHMTNAAKKEASNG